MTIKFAFSCSRWSVNNYSEFCFGQSEKYIIPKTLLDSEVMLEPYGFFRIHQSYLINLSYMEFFNTEEHTVYLSDGIMLPVSFRRKNILMERIKKVI